MHIASPVCNILPCKNIWWSQKTTFVCHSHSHNCRWFFWVYICKMWGVGAGLKSTWNSSLKKISIEIQFDCPARLSYARYCTKPRRSRMPPLSLKQSPLMLARALLGFIWKLQLWSLWESWGHSYYAAVKLVWNILTQMQVESKLISPSQWMYWGLNGKLLVLMLAYWQQRAEFLLPLLLLLVLDIKQTALKKQVNRPVFHFFYGVQNCHGYEHI